VAASIALCRMDSSPKLPRTRQSLGKGVGGHLEHPNGWHRDTAARLFTRDRINRRSLLIACSKNRIPLARSMRFMRSMPRTLRESTLLTAMNGQVDVRDMGLKFSEKFTACLRRSFSIACCKWLMILRSRFVIS